MRDLNRSVSSLLASLPDDDRQRVRGQAALLLSVAGEPLSPPEEASLTALLAEAKVPADASAEDALALVAALIEAHPLPRAFTEGLADLLKSTASDTQAAAALLGRDASNVIERRPPQDGEVRGGLLGRMALMLKDD